MTTVSTAEEVPGEPGVYWCARHKKEKTRLRCGRCEAPICYKCTINSPAGTRCRDCGSNRNSHIYKVSPLHYVLTFLASAVLSAIAGAIVGTVRFLILFLAPLSASALGKIVMYVTRGKRGVPLAIVASVGAIIGALLPHILFAIWFPQAMTHYSNLHTITTITLLMPFLADPYLWIYLFLVIPTIWYWIR